MIRFATPEMLPALMTMWQVCFSEQQAYVEFAFRNLIRPEHVLVSTDKTGAPLAMLCLQPARLCAPDGHSCACAYIYGVATLPRARGQGLSTALMETAHERLKGKGVSLSVLVPAGESLFRFYTDRGYEPGFSLGKVQVDRGEIPPAEGPCVLVPAALDQLEELRLQAFADSRMLVRWDRGFLKAIDAECRLSGGEVLRFACGPYRGYAVCYRHGDKIIVKELAAPSAAIDTVLAALHMRYQAQAYLLYLRADKTAKFTNAVLPFALVRWYDKKMKTSFSGKEGASAYIAHVLD